MGGRFFFPDLPTESQTASRPGAAHIQLAMGPNSSSRFVRQLLEILPFGPRRRTLLPIPRQEVSSATVVGGTRSGP
jgi:hypothetical protein